MRLRSISFGVVVSALLAFAGAPLMATSYVMVSDESLVDDSPVAAVVRVASVDRAAGRNAGQAITEYRIQVEEVLKGTIPEGIGGMATVRVPGGLGPNGMALKIYGAPRFEKDERALLFLEPTGDGSYRVMHLLLGAFHEVSEAGHQLAVRDLAEAREIRQTGAGVESVPGADRLRDFDSFARWVAERAANNRSAADYFVQDSGIKNVLGHFRLFADPDDGYHLRWFNFDTGGSVQWKAYKGGQPGLASGGFTEFQAALKDWNNEPETPINYTYGGKTSAKNGLKTYDQVNAILFNDLNNELPSFNCSTGGVLAYGGPWYRGETIEYLGEPYHPVANADVVINDGLACFFKRSHSGSKAAEELFAHELGHTLGLNHPCGDSDSEDPSCENPSFDDALMRAYIHDDGRGGRLGEDDKIGIWILYKPGGFALAPKAPTGLTAAPVSTTEVRLNWTDNSTDETGFKVEVKELTGNYAEILTLPANTTTAVVGGLDPATGYVFRVRAFNDSGNSVYSNEATTATNGPIGPCVADAHTLCLLSGRFRVQVDWAKPDGETGQASVVPGGSDNSGVLWFFDESNWEMLIKVIDGCSLTDHYWVFFAATTNVQFVVTVVDTQTGAVKTYVNLQGISADAVTDTQALPCS
ncbi:MAG TPA: fibronectin type III domain-containing protein [Thermoanaerobaculia bacterium]|jgi:hypothetical protein|nr:fibronectin type III domain-containing protein [Thermoanaerobaculia bacterium]